MTPQEKVNLYYTIENESFEYVFIYYSDFTEIQDPEFHRLRKEYAAAHKALESYIEPSEEDFEIAEGDSE